jgi:hypothetical protein
MTPAEPTRQQMVRPWADRQIHRVLVRIELDGGEVGELEITRDGHPDHHADDMDHAEPPVIGEISLAVNSGAVADWAISTVQTTSWGAVEITAPAITVRAHSAQRL